MPLGMLGKYERLDVLGHGASGIVYLAKDTLLGKQVALKEISAEGEERHRFLEEARVLDRLRHPNIVQVNGVDEIGGKVVIDMEYVRGRTLQEILRETPRLPVDEAVSIAAQVCDGLAFAHARRTVHRDIKPANILLTAEGMVKLVDFGLAEVLGTHSFAGGAGTYAYMAPEDFHAEEQSDRQSDLWAVGVVLYEMLAGQRPFRVAKAKDPFAWKQAIEQDPLVPVSGLRSDVPPALDAVLARALARDKAVRYREAAGMAHDLRELGMKNPPPPSAHTSLRGTPPETGGEGAFGASPLHPPVSGGSRGTSGVGSAVAGTRLPGLPPLSAIDDFLAAAPDRWGEAGAALAEGTLARWLRGIGEEPLSRVADEIAADPRPDRSDKLRDFLYRAGMETALEARQAYDQGVRLLRANRLDEALPFFQRAVRLDPARPAYHQALEQAGRAPERPAAQAVLSATQVDFGTLRRGQTRSARLTLRNEGGGVLEGRVVSAPGWVRVEPSAFAARGRQPLTLTAQTEGVQQTPSRYQDVVVLETSGGRQQISVATTVLPARLGLAQAFWWYAPLLIAVLLPALASLAVPGHDGALWRPGLAASILLGASLFALTWAADLVWPLRLLPLVLAASMAAYLSLMPSFASTGTLTRLALVQTATPALVLLLLQLFAQIADPRGWGRWQLWRWIVGATALLVAYSLLHLG